MIKYLGSVLFVLFLSLPILFFLGLPLSFFAAAAAETSSGAQIDIWWPTDGSHLQGSQPFKALLTEENVNAYDLYWQVGGGELVPMQNNYDTYPHKEASVDLSQWNWHGEGPYLVNFVAKQNGSIVGQHAVDIYVDGGVVLGGAALAATSTATAMPTTTVAVDIPATSTSASANAAPASTQTISVWWPTNGVQISGTQPFKAALSNWAIENYHMFWQVDGGAWVEMSNSYTDAPHKEASVDVSGWHWQSSGNYTLTFIAQDFSGNLLAKQSETIIVNPSSTDSGGSSSSTGSAGGGTINNVKLYVNPNSSAAQQAAIWENSNPTGAAAMQLLASQPTATWFGDWDSNIWNDVHGVVSAAQAQSAVPVLVAYNIPERDCGSFSAGGTSPSQYSSWIGSFASAIGNAPAIVILEPDALAQMSCLSSQDQQTRLQLISQAVHTLKGNGNTRVYIDAGHSGWVDPGTMANRLEQAGIGEADGFSLNISNFNWTSDETNYGTQISQQVGGKHFVIDTSRNGLGPNGLWCNPPGRAIGSKPTGNTGNALVDAYLWVKTPGESDGYCNGGPGAGTWWPDYALQLVLNAGQ